VVETFWDVVIAATDPSLGWCAMPDEFKSRHSDLMGRKIVLASFRRHALSRSALESSLAVQ
jgi:hypothetical protein